MDSHGLINRICNRIYHSVDTLALKPVTHSTKSLPFLAHLYYDLKPLEQFTGTQISSKENIEQLNCNDTAAPRLAWS